MGDLSANFSAWEFECKGASCCGKSAPMDPALVDALEELRELAGDRPMGINSGFRCRAYNATVENASPRSQHTLGRAADVRVPEGLDGEHFAELADQVSAFHTGGIGLYYDDAGAVKFLHLDTRSGGRRRWTWSRLTGIVVIE